MEPTIVLVHGAFAESSSWAGVLPALRSAGHRVIACAAPLRSLAGDAAYLSDLVRSIDGPVVLVGHSYGGAIVTNVDPAAGEIVAAVYVAGFALESGESCVEASSLAPGSTLSDTLLLVPLAGGGTDAYIEQDRYHQQFAADLSADDAARMAVTQRPVTLAALAEPSTRDPLWRSVPTWFVFGDLDRNIPVGAHRIMAERAEARGTTEVAGASHVVGISHHRQTAEAVLAAAAAAAVSA